MKRKYISKTGPWLEETAVKRSDTIEGVRMVKVMFPLEDESVVEERGRSDDIGDNFQNAIWPGSYWTKLNTNLCHKGLL